MNVHLAILSYLSDCLSETTLIYPVSHIYLSIYLSIYLKAFVYYYIAIIEDQREFFEL